MAVRVLVGSRVPELDEDDPRPLLDEAAAIGARYRAAGLLVCETLAAGLTYGRQLWFGTQRNIGDRLAEIAGDLHIAIHLAEPT